jgi:hypothetical protein
MPLLLNRQELEGDRPMKIMRKSSLCLVFVLLATPILAGQSLTSYRKFSLGTTLAALAQQVGQDPRQATLIHQSPAVIQELTYWPNGGSQYSGRAESVSEILFSFYNSELYKVTVTYDQDATEGMTDDDMVGALSSRYGTATRTYPEIALPNADEYLASGTVVARWQDSENSVTLIRSEGLKAFGLIVTSKKVDGEATAAIADSVKLETEQAPQKEIDRRKDEADKLEVARLRNIKAFRF